MFYILLINTQRYALQSLLQCPRILQLPYIYLHDTIQAIQTTCRLLRSVPPIPPRLTANYLTVTIPKIMARATTTRITVATLSLLQVVWYSYRNIHVNLLAIIFYFPRVYKKRYSPTEGRAKVYLQIVWYPIQIIGYLFLYLYISLDS